jgi:hypothetical protein
LVAVGAVTSGVSVSIDSFRLMAVGAGTLADLYEEAQKLVVVEAK